MALTPHEVYLSKKEYYKQYRELHKDQYKKYNHEYYLKNAEKLNLRAKVWGVNNRPKRLQIHKRNYKKYKRGNPEGVCPVCLVYNHVLVYDHNHTTGEFRGWICNKCNLALGLVKDSTVILSGLITYVNRSEKQYLVKRLILILKA